MKRNKYEYKKANVNDTVLPTGNWHPSERECEEMTAEAECGFQVSDEKATVPVPMSKKPQPAQTMQTKTREAQFTATSDFLGSHPITAVSTWLGKM